MLLPYLHMYLYNQWQQQRNSQGMSLRQTRRVRLALVHVVPHSQDHYLLEYPRDIEAECLIDVTEAGKTDY